MRKAWLTVEEQERIELRGRMLVGRGRHCDIVVNSARIGREQAIIESRGDAFFYTDLGANQGTFLVRAGVNWGKLRHAVHLRDGDELFASPRLFYQQEPPAADVARDELEAALSRAPDDAGAWAVYADRLLELGDPRGQRIISSSTEWESWGWPLREALELGALTWTFGHGHVRAATLRAPHQGWQHRAWPLSDLLSILCHADEARFMVELGLELSESASSLAHLREALARCHLPALQRLIVTPVLAQQWSTRDRRFAV